MTRAISVSPSRISATPSSSSAVPIPEREALEAALVCLRDPLSRIQLAASELEGASAIGASRSIRQAVGEIDLRIEDTLTRLRRSATESEPAADLRASLESVVADLERALAARGIELIVRPLPGQPIRGDDSLLRRSLCRLLLGVGRWMHTQPGVVEVELIHDDAGTGVQLAARLCGDAVRGRSRDILGPMRGFALAEHLALEASVAADASSATVVARFDRRFDS